MLVICFFSAVSQAKSNSRRIDQLQEALFGVSTLKGIKEVNPWVRLEIIKEGATELSTPSKFESLVQKDLKEQVIKTLEKTGIKINDKLGITSSDSPLSLNVTVFIKVTNTPSVNYAVFVYTEAKQSITLSRDNTIRSFSRTWPMNPMGLYNRNMFILNPQTLEKTVKDEVDRQVNFFISDFLAANPKPVSRSAVGVDIAALRKTLFEEDSGIHYGLRVRDEDLRLQVIKQLDMAGSKEAVNVLLEFLTHNRMDLQLKQHALTALGQIGTASAIEAVQQFDDWSKKRYAEPQPFQMGLQQSTIDHFAPYSVEPLDQTTDSENKTWALVPLNRYGKVDLWLTSLNEDNQWSGPIFLNLPEMPEPRRLSETTWNIQCRLQVEGDSLKIECDNKTYESQISGHLKDTDKDGLPDIVEARLLTDQNNPDSDGDGSLDGKDSNPLTPKHKKTDDTTEIRQAVFSALFATTNSQNAIVIVDRDDFAKQEYYGFGGVVLRAAKHRRGFVNVTSINIKYQSDDAATVTIGDWEGSVADSTHEAKLKKINNKWIVVEFRMTMIS